MLSEASFLWKEEILNTFLLEAERKALSILDRSLIFPAMKMTYMPQIPCIFLLALQILKIHQII